MKQCKRKTMEQQLQSIERQKTQPGRLDPLKCDGFYRKATTTDIRSVYKTQLYFYVPAIKYQKWKFQKLTYSSIDIMNYLV